MNIDKRGQVTIFVIIALVIVAAILIVFLYPRLRATISGGELNPTNYLRSCIQPTIKENIQELSKTGGYSQTNEDSTHTDTT